MANTKIQSEQIADSAIVTDRIAADAITTAKIADNTANPAIIEILLFAKPIVAAFNTVSSSLRMYTAYVIAIPIPAEQDHAD